MSSSLRDAILATSRPAPLPAQSEAWPDAFVRVLTVGEIIRQENDVQDEQNRPALARAVARVLCDAQGELVFDENKPEDVEAILNLPWGPVRQFLRQANKLNRIDLPGEAPGEAPGKAA